MTLYRLVALAALAALPLGMARAQSDDATVRSDVVRGDEAVEARTGSDIDHVLTGLDHTETEWVGDTGEGFDRPIR